MNTWIHIVVKIDGMMITDSIRVEGALDLADHITKHVNKGGEIIAITTSEEWNSQKPADPTDEDLEAMAAAFELEVPE